jgi:hypothetical protein
MVQLFARSKMEEVNQAMAASGSASAAVSSGKATAIFSGAGGAIMAMVVMTLTPPNSKRELFIMLLSTLVFSVCGSAFLKIYFGLSFPDDINGHLASSGLSFVCGAPGWVLIRAFFVTAETMKGKSIGEIIATVKGWFK